MLRGQHHVGAAEQGVGPGREDLQGAERFRFEREKDFRAGAAPDPGLLHPFGRLGPIDVLQIGEQPLRIGGDPQHPLAQVATFHRVAADLALPVGDLFIREHRAQFRTPPDRTLVHVGEAGAEKLQENPLGPAKIFRIGRVDLPFPIVGEAERLDLLAEIGDVVLGVGRRRRPRLDRVLLGGKSEGVPADRMQDLAAPRPPIAGDDVGGGVALGVADVQSGAGRIRKHVEHVIFRSGPIVVGSKGMIFFPERLPVRLDFLKVVVFALGSHRVKPAIVNLSSFRSTPPAAELVKARRDWKRGLRAGLPLKVLMMGLLLAPATGAQAAGMSRGFNRLLNAVVRIDVREVAFDEGTRRFEASIGSGVVLSADGLVLTNAHVVGPRAVEINITLANLERVRAHLVGWDHWTDLAVLRLNLDMAEVGRRGLKFAHADLGDSDKLYPGEMVCAVGTPYGLTRTVTRGIISNTSQYFEADRGVDGYETGSFNTWLQTDAAINPGNSGGPLVTEDGRIVGISSRSYLGANNLGFAIPVNTAKRIVPELVRDGLVTRSYIGVVPRALQDLEGFYALALNTGMLIDSVDPGSPAARAGLHGGDILLAINDRPVDGRFPELLPAIQNLIASQPVGATLELTIKRGAGSARFTVVTERLESSVGDSGPSRNLWGLSVRKISRTYARENQLPDDTGILIVGVQPGFPADLAGLQAGDIVTKINRIPVTSLAVAKSALAAYSAKKPEPTLFEAERDRRVSLYIRTPCGAGSRPSCSGGGRPACAPPTCRLSGPSASRASSPSTISRRPKANAT